MMDVSANQNPDKDADWKSRIVSFWDRLAPKYMRYTEAYLHRNSWVNQRLQIVFPGMKNLRIADIGTGCGFLAISYAELGHRVTATDISDGMLECARALARKKGLDIEFVKDDAADTHLPKDTFDLVVLRDVVCSMEGPKVTLQNLAKIVRPGGYLMVCDGHYFRYLHDQDYAERQRYFTMKFGRREYERMLNLEPEEYRELEALIGDLDVNKELDPYWMVSFMLELGFNNARIRADDWDDYDHLTEYGALKVPLRYTFFAQKMYFDGLQQDHNDNPKSFRYKNAVETPDILGSQFLVLGNEDRIRIIESLSSGERCVSEVARDTELSVNKVSYHLGILSEGGFVLSERKGREIYYRIKDVSALEHLIYTVSQLYTHR